VEDHRQLPGVREARTGETKNARWSDEKAALVSVSRNRRMKREKKGEIHLVWGEIGRTPKFSSDKESTRAGGPGEKKGRTESGGKPFLLGKRNNEIDSLVEGIQGGA